jgi:hypothetical protein
LEDKILKGKGLTIASGDTLFSENLRIEKVSGRIVYFADISDQNDGKAISFPLESRKTDVFHFENLDHDFPNRIIYEFHSDTLLEITVENAPKTTGFKLKLKKTSE